MTSISTEDLSCVAIIVGPHAPDLEQYAAEQLGAYLNQLFGITTQPSTEIPPNANLLFFVGTADSIPLVKEAMAGQLHSSMTAQTIVLRRTDDQGRPAMVLSGGSPRAVMWAVYDLVERWGVRFLLHGDVLPEGPVFQLPETDVVITPALPIRQWRVMNVFACGPESWGMAHYRPIIDQLAKLKFNRIFIVIWPWQPFLHLEVRGVKRETSSIWFNEHFPITDDMIGRDLFGDDREFWNPDLPMDATYDELSAAGEELIHNIMDYAHQRGMEVVIDAMLVEYPQEFGPMLGTTKSGMLGMVTPPAGSDPDDPLLVELATAVIHRTVQTYPEIDYLRIGMPEHRSWIEQYERAWKALDTRYGVGKEHRVEDLLSAAAQRPGYHSGGERAMNEVKGDLVALYFYDRLINDLQVFKDTQRPDMKLMFGDAAEELYPLLQKVLPPGSETMDFVDYTPSRILNRRNALQTPPGGDRPSIMIYTLHDDNVGILPQLSTTALHELTKELYRYGWSGFSTRYWLIADHEPCVAYLAKAGWDTSATPDTVYRDHIQSMCGSQCEPDMLEMFRELEEVTRSLEWHGLGLTFPVPGMIMKHWKEGEMPAELAGIRQGYERARGAAQRALSQSSEYGCSYLQYWIGRFEFGISYIDTIEAVCMAATAESSNNSKDTLRNAEQALATGRAAIGSYARVIRDQSDRGAIAILNEYVYRPLKQKVEELKAESE